MEKKTAEENRQDYIKSVLEHTAKQMADPFNHDYNCFHDDVGGCFKPIATVIEIMGMDWHVRGEKEYEFSKWQYARAIKDLRDWLDRCEKNRLPLIEDKDNEVQWHARKLADVPTETLIEWYLNARTTYNQCGGHGKAQRNKNAMERYWNALTERRSDPGLRPEGDSGEWSLDEVKSRKGVFNGEGSS